MKVKCIKLYNSITKKFKDKSEWLTIGKEYIISEITIRPEIDVFFRLQGDNKNELPVLFDSRQFEVISNKIPSNWILKQDGDRILTFTPAAWSVSGFWEDYFDGVPSAIEIYRRELKIILEEES